MQTGAQTCDSQESTGRNQAAAEMQESLTGGVESQRGLVGSIRIWVFHVGIKPQKRVIIAISDPPRRRKQKNRQEDRGAEGRGEGAKRAKGAEGRRTDSYMALLDKGDSLFQRLAKFEAHEHDGKAAAAKRRDGQRLALQQALLGRDQPHAKELVDEQIRRLSAHRIALLEELKFRGQLCDLPPACVSRRQGQSRAAGSRCPAQEAPCTPRTWPATLLYLT